jgi:hypothetical protein
MNRRETIELIAKTLQSGATDAELDVFASEVSSRYGRSPSENDGGSVLPRVLTTRELALLEQAKDDFKLGRTMSLAELEQFLDAQASLRAAARSA